MSFFWPAPTGGWTVDPCSRSGYFISLGVSTSNPLDLSSLGAKSFNHASYWPAGKALQSTRRESCLSKQSHKVFGGEFLSFWFFLILSELLKEKGCRIVFGFLFASGFVPFALYLQQLGTRTCHFAWYLLHSGMVTLHFAWYLLHLAMFAFHFAWYLLHFGTSTSHLHGICYI